MPKYYCDYCDIYLTHDSPSVRRAHNSGWKHLLHVKEYYAELGHDQAQDVIDKITTAHQSRGIAVPAYLTNPPPATRPPPPTVPSGMPVAPPIPGLPMAPPNLPYPNAMSGSNAYPPRRNDFNQSMGHKNYSDSDKRSNNPPSNAPFPPVNLNMPPRPPGSNLPFPPPPPGFPTNLPFPPPPGMPFPPPGMGLPPGFNIPLGMPPMPPGLSRPDGNDLNAFKRQSSDSSRDMSEKRMRAE